MIATIGFLADLECTKFVFGRGSVPTPLGELTALPRPSSWFKGPMRRGGEGQGKGKGKGAEGNRDPPSQIPESAPVDYIRARNHCSSVMSTRLQHLHVTEHSIN